MERRADRLDREVLEIAQPLDEPSALCVAVADQPEDDAAMPTVTPSDDTNVSVVAELV